MSQHEMIYDKISEMIQTPKTAPEALTPETTLPELELDSLDYVELMVLAKREFNVTLNPEMFMKNPTMTLRELSQRIAQEMAG